MWRKFQFFFRFLFNRLYDISNFCLEMFKEICFLKKLVRLALSLLTPPLCTEGCFAKTPKPIFNAKITAELQKSFFFLNFNIRRIQFDQKSPRPLEGGVLRWQEQKKNTYRQTDIATSRLNRPKGRFSKNSYNTIYCNLNVMSVYLYL